MTVFLLWLNANCNVHIIDRLISSHWGVINAHITDMCGVQIKQHIERDCAMLRWRIRKNPLPGATQRYAKITIATGLVYYFHQLLQLMSIFSKYGRGNKFNLLFTTVLSSRVSSTSQVSPYIHPDSGRRIMLRSFTFLSIADQLPFRK